MLKSILALAAALSFAACAAKSSSDAGASASGGSGGLAVTAAFAPDPPVQGLETITVTVKDASGAAVRGARVKITTDMPAMSMKGPTSTAKDNGDGTYTASAKLNYNTKWSFAITADAGEQHTTVTVEKDVQ